MTALFSRAARELFRRELLPARVRWWFAAEGMREWCRLIRDELAPHLGGREQATTRIAELCAPLFRRRYALLRKAFPALPDPATAPRAVGLVMSALYRVAADPASGWIFAASGGAAVAFADHAQAEGWIAELALEARWDEVTHHLGELLIALTEGLPAHMARPRPILGEICFAAGLRYGRKIKRAFALGDTPEEALEALRMSEYVFQVNPDHWGETKLEARTGWLEGTACPWYEAPGWNGVHCGIFGQFQAGITGAFGLRYHLTTTIPRHGGHTCRIDIRPIDAAPSSTPIAIHRSKDGPVVGPGTRS
jgi:hypothetical protein